jgi:hypothetical protein
VANLFPDVGLNSFCYFDVKSKWITCTNFAGLNFLHTINGVNFLISNFGLANFVRFAWTNNFVLTLSSLCF